MKFKNIIQILSSLSIISLSSLAFAAGYQLPREYNAVEIGNAGAGGAALAEDASTSFANPAGLVRIPNAQITVSGDGVFTYSKFQGSNSVRTTAFPLPTFTQTGSATTTDKALVPGFYFTTPINVLGLKPDVWSFGFSINSPFGLSTSYGNDSVIRFSSTTAKIQTIDISPSIAFKINKQLSFGFGLDFDRVGLDFRQEVGLPTFPVIGPLLNAYGRNVGNGWGYGFHTGLLYQLSNQTRVGFAYHSTVNVVLKGYSDLTGALVSYPANLNPSTISNNSFRTKFILPPTSELSAHHAFNERWAMDGSVAYTQWGVLSGTQSAFNVVGLAAPLTVNIAQHYHNSWAISLGGSYQYTNRLMFRAGVLFDQSPILNSERNVTLPDNNREGIGIGAHYQANNKVSFDAGWLHLFVNNANVSAPLMVGSQISTANGSYTHSYVDIVGFQANYNFV